jgi:hypothetical protein
LYPEPNLKKENVLPNLVNAVIFRLSLNVSLMSRLFNKLICKIALKNNRILKSENTKKIETGLIAIFLNKP